MTLRINGEFRETEVISLQELFVELMLPIPLLLVEYNGTALTRSQWESIHLSDGDCLEILSVAAGG